MDKIRLFYKALDKILEIRNYETAIAKDFSENKIWSFLHLTIGQEATAVGIAMGLEKKDYFFGNHRSHGHYLSKGGDYKKYLYETYGDVRGCCKGFGGSMHVIDRKVNFLGSTPILGAGAPISTGMAFAKKLDKEKNILVCFLGDGSAEEGSFYESVNLAGLLKVPILFVIEDNQYSVKSTHNQRKVKGYNFKNLFGKGLNTIFHEVNGQDFYEVYKTAKKIREQILSSGKIGVIHSKVLRFHSHSGTKIDLSEKYRQKDKKKVHEKNDCIKILIKKLIRSGENSEKIQKFITKKEKYYIGNFLKTRKTIKIRQVK